MQHTRPPDRYVPAARVFGPTSNLGKLKRNTLVGSYLACPRQLFGLSSRSSYDSQLTFGIDIVVSMWKGEK